MNFRTLHFLAVAFIAVGFTMPADAEIRREKKSSLLNNDPNVVYREEFTAKPIELLVVKPGAVYPTKEGGRVRGNLRVESKVELIGFTDRAYNIRGELTNGTGVSGWVSPQVLASRDKDFVANLEKLYERQLKVRELIAKGQIALGMTPDEVGLIFGEPTKATMRRTAKGRSGTWQFIKYEEQKNYTLVRDPTTGNVYRQLASITKQEVNNTKIEFEDDVVSAIEESENNGAGRTVTVPAPIFIAW